MTLINYRLVLYRIVLYCIVWYCTVLLYCIIVFYCIVFYCIIQRRSYCTESARNEYKYPTILYSWLLYSTVRALILLHKVVFFSCY